jgi:hypothetical protein
MTASENQIVVYQPTGELVRGSTTEDFSVVRMATSERREYGKGKRTVGANGVKGKGGL